MCRPIPHISRLDDPFHFRFSFRFCPFPLNPLARHAFASIVHDVRSWPHPLRCVRACVRLLFEGGYYFLGRVSGAATNWGAASIRINTVVVNKSKCDAVLITETQVVTKYYSVTNS